MNSAADRRPSAGTWAAALVVLLLGATVLASTAEAGTVQVLHWWTSVSERRAADALAARLAEAGVQWQDAAVAGGAGVGAGKVLRSRVLAGDAPDAAQMVGVTLTEAAGMGLLLELDSVAAAERWPQVLFPAVHDLVGFRGHVVAAPLGIHRINTIVWHRGLFERLQLAPPLDAAAFDRAAAALQSAGIVPLALSSEPWQVASLFETLVLAEGGPPLHRALFERRSAAAAADARVQRAFERLRALKALAGQPSRPAKGPAEEPWTATLQRLQRGEAAMMVMGDWVVGELRQAGWSDGVEFGCAAAPGTAGAHLYSVDSLAMFARDFSRVREQQQLARTAASAAVQAEYNSIKGSAPVRRDLDPVRLPPCTRASWSDFARGAATLAPSLVHRMATDETSKDAVIAELHRYFTDDRITPAEAQRRLAALYRVLPPAPVAERGFRP